MSFCDPISDALTRIRNASMIKRKNVTLRHSKVVVGILEVMKREGYINDYQVNDLRPGIREIIVNLKYRLGKSVIAELHRVSKPGCREYSEIDNLKKVNSGLGISIISTSKGILSDFEARQQNVGGEVLCSLI